MVIDKYIIYSEPIFQSSLEGAYGRGPNQPPFTAAQAACSDLPCGLVVRTPTLNLGMFFHRNPPHK